MAWLERTNGLSDSDVSNGLCLGCKCDVILCIGSVENWSDSNRVSGHVGDARLFVVDHESEDTVQLVDEVLHIPELVVQVEQDLAIRASPELKTVLGFEGLIVVNFSVGDDGDVAHLHRLICRLADVVDPESVEAHHQAVADLDQLVAVRASALLLVERVPQMPVAERILALRSNKIAKNAAHSNFG